MIDETTKFNRAEGYYKRDASMGNVDGSWKNFVASAESDKIKAMMNEKHGPGTIKYGSEIPQPEIKTPQAAFEFSQRNPAAEGGRMRFDNGLSAKKKKALTITYPKSNKDLEIKKSGKFVKKLDKANEKRKMDSVNELYEKYGKEVVDDAAKEWAEMSNLEPNRKNKLKVQNLDIMESGVDRSNFKVKFLKDIEDFGKWTPDRKSIKNKKLYPGSSTSNKMSFESRIYDALGRKDSPNYDLPKLKAMQKNFAEYKILKTYLKDNFGIVTALDHPLDKATIETIMNASSKDLINVNILEQNLNDSFKKTLNNRYRQAVLDGNLDQKRAVETIAKDLNFNIGSVPDNQFKAKQVGPFELNKIDKGVGSFETLDIKKEMLKSLKNSAKLNTTWGKYIKDNPDVFKTAGIDLKKLKKPKNIENIANNIDEIEKYITDRTGKVKPPSSFIGASSGFNTDLIAEDLKKIMDTEGFKTFKANIADPALEAAGKAVKVGYKVAALPLKIFSSADLVLGYLDYTNNKQKGYSDEDAIKHMIDATLINTTSFGEKADIEGVRKIANKNNMSNEVFDNLMAVNTNQKKFMDTVSKSKAKFNESMDIIESGAADPTAENMLIQKLKVDTKKSLTNTMKNIVKDSRSLETNLQVQEAGAPININVNKEKAFSDLGSSSREFVQNRIDASDLEKIANQKDTTKGGIGDAAMSGLKAMYTQPKFIYDLINPFSPLPKAKEFFPKDLNYTAQMEQLKKEDPTMYYKMLQSKGIDPRINLNIPVQLEFEQKYGNIFGTQMSDKLTQNKAEGGIIGLRSKYEYKK